MPTTGLECRRLRSASRLPPPGAGRRDQLLGGFIRGIFTDKTLDPFFGKCLEFSLQSEGFPPGGLYGKPDQDPGPVGGCGFFNTCLVPFEAKGQVLGLPLVIPIIIRRVQNIDVIPHKKTTHYKKWVASCAHDWTRTSTSLRTLPPQGSVSTNSTTWAFFGATNIRKLFYFGPYSRAIISA